MENRKTLAARLLDGREQSEEYKRTVVPAGRWALFGRTLKQNMGKLVLLNLMVLLTFLPVIAVFILRNLAVVNQGALLPYGSGFGVGYPVIPNLAGITEQMIFRCDLFYFAFYIPAGIIGALGLAGGMYCVRNLLWTGRTFILHDFGQGIKRGFFCAAEATLIFTLVLYGARTAGNYADYAAAVHLAGADGLIALKVIGYLLVALLLPVCMWMIPLGINFKQGPWQVFRNAVVLAAGTFPQTVFFAALASALVFFAIFIGAGSFFYFIAITLLILISLSFGLLLWMDYCQWAFDKYVNPAFIIEAEKAENEKRKKRRRKGAEEDPEAARHAAAMLGRSKILSRPVKPVDEGEAIAVLPQEFCRADLMRLTASKEAEARAARLYVQEHEKDEKYAAYNRLFDDRERAILEEEAGLKKRKRKRAPRRPKMLNKR